MIDFGEHQPRKKTLDMTPMLDVVFLLLIFFLLTSIFSKPAIPLNLPEAETSVKRQENASVIAIRSNGELLLDGITMEPVALFENLAVRLDKAHDRSVSIASDRDVPFGRVVEIMDRSRTAGARDIAVVTEQKQ